MTRSGTVSIAADMGVEVRKRNPLVTTVVGSVLGAMLLGGVAYSSFEKDEGPFSDVLLYGLVGAVHGAPVGLVVGIAVPFWNPLYEAPESHTSEGETPR